MSHTENSASAEIGPSGSPPTDRVVAILEFMAGRQAAVSIKDLSVRLELSRSTTTLIMGSLEQAGWVERHSDRRFALGAGLLRVSDAVHRNHFMRHNNEVLSSLAERTGYGVTLIRVSEREAMFVGIARRGKVLPTAIQVGTCLPVQLPLGAAALAHRSSSYRRAWLAATPEDVRSYNETMLAQAREAGFVAGSLGSTDQFTLDLLGEMIELLGERPHVASLGTRASELISRLGGPPYSPSALEKDVPLPISFISAPVFDHGGHSRHEIMVTPFAPRVPRAERRSLIAELKAAADEVQTDPE